MPVLHLEEEYQVSNTYIVYKAENTAIPPGIVKQLGSFQDTWTLGILAAEIVEHFDFAKYKAQIVDESIAYGALFYQKCDRDGTGLYIKAVFDEGEKPQWEFIVGSTGKGYEQAQKYYATADDIAKGAAFHKLIMRLHVQEVFQKRFDSLPINKNSVETVTWNQQVREAEAYLLNNTVATPALSALALARNITVADLANRVIAKANAYSLAIIDLLGQQQSIIDQISAVQTIEECNIICENLFGIPMPPQQAVRLGLCFDNNGYTRKVPINYGIQF